MARLAGPFPDETVWDPFCGSALELIERVRLTGVRRILGTDLSPDAIQAARANWQAARFPGVSADFVLRDFRDFEKIPNYGPASISLLITNPPLGKRVPIPNLRGLLEELFTVASVALRPGGRMVWINPLKNQTSRLLSSYRIPTNRRPWRLCLQARTAPQTITPTLDSPIATRSAFLQRSVVGEPILNLSCYHFTPLNQLEDLKSVVKSKCLELGIKGTILLAHEGINFFLSGTRSQLDPILQLLRSHTRPFADSSQRESRLGPTLPTHARQN